MGNVQHKDILSLYQNISSLCAKECRNEKRQELCSKMKSVVLNTSVFASSISFFVRDKSAIFASMLTSRILVTSDWDLHDELSPHTTVCVCGPVSLLLWEQETQQVSLTCDPVTSSDEGKCGQERWQDSWGAHLTKRSPATVSSAVIL